MIIALTFPACTGNSEETSAVSPDTDIQTQTQTDAVTSESIETAPPQDNTKYYTNPLTGELNALYDNVLNRPVAVVLKNDKTGAPQLGIEKADIIYEAAVEGGMTRLLALYSDYAHAGDIGPVIDSRAYFFDFAKAHDAILVQAGSTSYGKTSQKEDGIDCIDAVAGEMSPTFRRDEALIEERGYSSSIIAEGGRVFDKIELSGMRSVNNVQTSLTMNFTPLFTGYSLDGNICMKVSVPYSSTMTPYFEYSTLTNAYTRYQYGDVHKDNNGNALKFTNVLILFADHTVVDSTSGEMDVATVGSGSGYYVCGGKYIPITWERENAESPFKYYETNGKLLEICRGKTFVCITSEKRKNDVTFE